MTIEWTTTEPRPPRVVRRELQVYEVANGERADRRRATPADLVAALAAMGEGERAEVLGSALPDERVARREWVDETRVIIRALPTESIQDAARRVVRERDEEREALRRAHELCAEVTQKRIQAERECTAATARAEKAERERDRMAAEFGCCPGELPDDGEIARIRRERDEARKELDRVRASLDVVRHDLDGTRQELREAREARDSLRTRLIAAESAAAARVPREYPLAEGSRIQGETLVTAGGVRMSIRGQGTHCRGPSLDVELKCRERYWLPLRDVLALAHRRGLV